VEIFTIMQQLTDSIKKLSAKYADEAIQWRRHFHAHPELAFQEHETAAYISRLLESFGIPYSSGVARTGVVGLIEGKNAGKTIALRADMDALEITETSNLPYKSTVTGCMHACGHDVHMACLLGAARILKEISGEFSGAVKLIFQPSEEKYPGGASVMISEGVLKNPDVQTMFGQHVLPTLEAGKIGLRPGKYMASTDEIFITVRGKGGHAATPELNVDPVTAAAHIVVALQQLVSRLANPAIPSVLSFGKISGNGKTNVIPDQVVIEGTFRTYNEEWRSAAHEKIKKIASSVAESTGAQCDVFIDRGYPCLVNDDEVTMRTRNRAIEYLGKENVADLELRMTAEDFAYYAAEVPSCFYRLGVRNESKKITSNLHTSTFDADETAIETGMGFMAYLALCELTE
jgi:amidohydrolase